LSRRDSRQRTTVGWFQDKGDDVGRLLDTSDDTIGARRLSGIHVRLLVKPRLFRDELECEQPVDLAPRGRDLGSDSFAQNLTHRGEQVLADNRVLLGANSERDVLVGDAVPDVVECDGASGSISWTAYATTEPAKALLCSPVA
jgi:hypothetical protein